MNPALASIAHRPWPLPTGRWVMTQTWHDLLFAHWPVPAEYARRLVPNELPLDLFEGKAWIGVVPFHMSGIRGRGLPPVPALSRFPELNVRTYVTLGGKPGVYFFSLDAASAIAVWAARRFYRLPYFHAEMTSEERGERVHYRSRRFRGDAQFEGEYAPTGPPEQAPRGSLGHWLTERYCLYTVWAGRVYRGEIHHAQWPLQNAEADIATNTMAEASGIELPRIEPVLHFARRLEVLIWPLREAGREG